MKMKFLSIQTKSLEDFGATNYADLWQKAQKEGFKGLSILVKTEMTRSTDNKFHAVFSTSKQDRHGDIVYQNWDLKAFKNNPVYLDSHNYGSIEHILGKVEKIKKDSALEGDIVFALDNPKGLLAYKLAQGGFLNTSSVGFIPKEFDKEGNITNSELLEISAVSVPANADALYDSKSVETKEVVVEKKELTGKQAIAKMAMKKIGLMNTLLKAVDDLAKENKHSQFSEVHKILRKMQKDI